MRTKTITTIILAGLMAVGCDNTPVTPDAGPGTDSGPMPMVDSGPRPDSGPTGDGNDSFATAENVTVGAGASGAIGTPGDHDFFAFEGTEGDWMIISTDANPDDDPAMVDTVVTLFNASMTQIAENDDAQPRANTDSEIIIRLPSTGTFYVEVQEFSTWAGDTPEGMGSFTYDLAISALNTDAALVNLDAEAGNDVASAQALGWNTDGNFNLVVGGFADATDVDVFSFEMLAARPLVQFTVMPSGVDGNGSSTTPSRIWITDATGATVIARIAPPAFTEPNNPAEIQPSLAEGSYLLFVEHGPSAGANDFYVLKSFLSADNPPETMEVTNGVVATPEPITLELDTTTMLRRGFVLATLGDADTDFYSFDVMTGEAVSVFCGSRSSGSGVVGLQAAVLDSTGTTTVSMGTETEIAGASIRDAAATPGTYVLRLTKTSQDAEVTGNWVRCGIAVGAPTAP